jgi:LPXTG-motif cell wall-anchored protein
MLRAFVSTCAAVALVYGLSVPATAYTFDRRTHFTFNQPIALPGVTLPAGTYTFRLADPTSGGKVVQILNHSGTQSFAMLLSIPAYRAEPAEESEFTFMETASGMPAAVKIWWQEGSTRGYEFIYPKSQVDRLTRGVPPEPSVSRISRPSVTADSAIAAESSALPGFAEEDADRATADIGETAAAEQAPGPEGQFARPAPATVSAQEPTPQSADQAVREELPRTATVLPLAVVMGALMLLGGGWLARKARS